MVSSQANPYEKQNHNYHVFEKENSRKCIECVRQPFRQWDISRHSWEWDDARSLYQKGQMMISDERCCFICTGCSRFSTIRSYCISCQKCGCCLAPSKQERPDRRRWKASVDRHTCPNCSRYTYGFLKKTGLFRTLLQLCWTFYREQIIPTGNLCSYSNTVASGSLAEAAQRRSQQNINGFLDWNLAEEDGSRDTRMA